MKHSKKNKKKKTRRKQLTQKGTTAPSQTVRSEVQTCQDDDLNPAGPHLEHLFHQNSEQPESLYELANQ